MIAVTGSTDHLGRLVIDELLKTVPADRMVANARDRDEATALADAREGARYDGGDHERLLGRRPTPLTDAVAEALAG